MATFTSLTHLLAVASLFVSCSTSSPTLPTLSGNWILSAGYLEEYTVTSVNSTFFDVTCNQGDGACTAWHTANISISTTGNEGGNLVLTIDFDSGLIHTGSLSNENALITWSDNSQWLRVGAAGPITIHLAMHAHLDPGWKSTLNFLYNNSVRSIFTAVTQALAQNFSRTFNPEIAVFFSMWWQEQNETIRDQVRQFVATGQLEFTGGGWTQNDEAIVTFQDTIDQMTLGHLFIKSALNQSFVQTSWQADPFGRSTTQALLYSSMVMDGFTFGRPMSSGNDPSNFQSDFLWHPSASFPDPGVFDSKTILTRSQTIGYWEPYRSMHSSLVNGQIEEAATILLGFVTQMATKTPSVSNILIMCGDDFALYDALTVWPAMDQTIALFNELQKNSSSSSPMTVIYSTPSRFYKALAEEQATSPSPSMFPARPAWDMLPLIGCEFPSPWTGFYTSRPEFKHSFHAASSFRRAVQSLHSLARDNNTWEDGFNQLLVLWEAVGLVQHHDSITGDSYDNVMEDFKQYIDAGLSNSSLTATTAMGVLSNGGANTAAPCLNISSAPCDTITSALSGSSPVPVYITIFNPVAWTRDEWVEVVVPIPTVAVTAISSSSSASSSPSTSTSSFFTATPVPSQVAPAVDTDYAETMYVLTFLASNLPPLGYSVYQLTTVAANSPGSAFVSTPQPLSTTTTITSGGNFSLTFTSNGTLVSASNLLEGVFTPLNAQVVYYTSTGGTENAWDFATQGKFANSTIVFPGYYTTASGTLTTGPLFQEVRQVIDVPQGISLRFRLYQGDAFARMYTATGPYTIVNNHSVDTILRLDTNSSIQNNATFYTDSNSLELMQRVRDARPWWTSGAYFDSADPVSSNYYPITSSISMTDVVTGTTLGLLPVLVSHGGSSMLDGELEVMVGRSVVDSTGNLNTGNRHVTVGDILTLNADKESFTTAMRPIVTKLANPVVMLATTTAPSTLTGISFAPLAAAFPPQVELLTLQTLPPGMNVSNAVQLHSKNKNNKNNKNNMKESFSATPVSETVLLVRVRHIYAVGEGEDVAQPVDIDFSTLFAPFWNVTGITEMTLTATRVMADARAQQIQWQQQSPSSSSSSSSSASPVFKHPSVNTKNSSSSSSSSTASVSSSSSASSSEMVVTLRPMDIKTFILQLD